MTVENGTPSTDQARNTTYESRVNEVISNVTKSEDGKLTFPEGTDENLAFSATAEIRRRDTQSAYTKNQQTLKALQAENEKLASSWESDAVANLSSTEQAKLEELKVQDPDTWRSEIARLEEEKRSKFKERRTAISEEASQMTEIERRGLQLEQFNKDHPGLELTDDVIENDVPPRITRKLEKGEIQFDEYLAEVADYLGKPKKIDTGEQAPRTPDFAGVRSSGSPSQEALDKQSKSDYNKEVF